MPPARLKVLWESVGDFREREDRWRRLDEAGISEEDGRLDAAGRVVELLFEEQEVTFLYKGAGAIRVRDPAGLAVRLGLEADEISAHPLAFSESEALIAPWEITELVVTIAARRNPGPIPEYVANEDRKAQYEAIHGRWSRGGRRSSDYFFEPEDCAELDAKYYRRGREVLRSWCGAEAIDRFDEIAELRKEIRRVGDIAQSAIDALRSAGHAREASRLQRQLGRLSRRSGTLTDLASPVAPGSHAAGHELVEIVWPYVLRHDVGEQVEATDRSMQSASCLAHIAHSWI